MKKISTLLALGIALPSLLQAQSAGNVIYNQRNGNYASNTYGGVQLVAYTPPPGVNLTAQTNHLQTQSQMQTIRADVMINVKATSYTAIYSINQNGKSIEQTDSLMNIRIDQMVRELKKNPSIKFEYHVDFISLVPRYKKVTEEKRFSKTVNEVPDGFEMKKNIHVLFYDHDHLAPISAAAGRSEIYELVKVEYNVKDMDAIYDQLRTKAKSVLDAKYVKRTGLGFKLELEAMGETQGSVYPIERYAHYTAYKTGTPEYVVIEERRKKDKDTPQQTAYNNVDKSETIYYERIPYNQFDVVLNADVAEPTVQFYYSLQVNYTVIDDDAEQLKKEDRELAVELKKAEIYQKYHPEDKKPPVKNQH